MTADQTPPADVDQYIAAFPSNVRTLLERMRSTVRAAAPDAVETIKYGIPTFVLHGNLVHFGGFKEHIGFYATPEGNEKFRKELSAYEGAKGSVRFPLDQPIPFDLVTRIVKFRVNQNAERAAAKRKKR